MRTPAQSRFYQKRVEALRALKAAPCVDCGGSFPTCVMEFDHRDPTEKVRAISRMKTFPWKAVVTEIEKCDLVCTCCHRLRTAKGDVSFHTRRYKFHRSIVDALKTRTPCADCGKNLQPTQMDFDHLCDKVSNVSHLLDGDTERLVSEIKKCQIVCANCHRIRCQTGVRTSSDQQLPRVFREIQLLTEFPPDLRLVRDWHPLVGTMTDVEIAQAFALSRTAVSAQRRRMGVPSFRSQQRVHNAVH
jgi:hypothetical protein